MAINGHAIGLHDWVGLQGGTVVLVIVTHGVGASAAITEPVKTLHVLLGVWVGLLVYEAYHMARQSADVRANREVAIEQDKKFPTVNSRSYLRLCELSGI